MDQPTRKFEKIRRRSNGEPVSASVSHESAKAGLFEADVVAPEGPIGREGANDVMFGPLAESAPEPATRSRRPPVAHGVAGRVEQRTLIETRLIAGNSLANVGRILST